MLGLLYLAVLAVQIVLPEDNALRTALGGSLAEWLVLGVLCGAGDRLPRRGWGASGRRA